jgi:hypothetical protein
VIPGAELYSFINGGVQEGSSVASGEVVSSSSLRQRMENVSGMKTSANTT